MLPLTKLLTPTLLLLLASPVMATPNDLREIELEIQETQEQARDESENLSLPERLRFIEDVIDDVKFQTDSFYGTGIGYPLIRW